MTAARFWKQPPMTPGLTQEVARRNQHMPSRSLVAWHEAGHVTAAYLIGADIEECWVPRDLNAGRGYRGGQAGGRTTSGVLYTDSDRMDALIVAAAAEAAERFIGMDSDGFEADRYNAAKLSLEVARDYPDKAMKLNAQAEAFARRLVAGDHFQGLCTRLAEYVQEHQRASGEEMFPRLRGWDKPPTSEVRALGFGRWGAFRYGKRQFVSNRKQDAERAARDGQRAVTKVKGRDLLLSARL